MPDEINPFLYAFVGQFRATAPQFDPRRPKLRTPPQPIAPFARAAEKGMTQPAEFEGASSSRIPRPIAPFAKAAVPQFKSASDYLIPTKPFVRDTRPKLKTPPAKTFTQREGVQRDCPSGYVRNAQGQCIGPNYLIPGGQAAQMYADTRPKLKAAPSRRADCPSGYTRGADGRCVPTPPSYGSGAPEGGDDYGSRYLPAVQRPNPYLFGIR